MARPKDEERVVDANDPAFDPALREPNAPLDQQIEHIEQRDTHNEAQLRDAPLATPDRARQLENEGVPLPGDKGYIPPGVDPATASDRHDEERGL